MWIAAVAFVLILAMLLYMDGSKPQNFPPGPRWLPIFGNALLIGKLRKQHKYLYTAVTSLSEKYGPVLGLKIGKDHQVVVNNYEAMKEFLTNNDFDGRPQGIFYTVRTMGERRGLLVTDEELWYEQRRFVLKHLKEFGFGRRTMAGMIEDEAMEFVKYYKQRVGASGAVLPMQDAFGISVLNTLWTMLAGIRYSPEDSELKALQKLLTELFATIDMVGCLFSQFPILRFVAPKQSGYTRYVQTHQRLWHFLQMELDKHKKSFIPGEPRDLMDAYLEMLTSNERKRTFSEKQLLAICMDMFMAGSETTSKSLAFGFLYLLLNPQVQQKAQAQLDEVVGRDRLPNMEDRPNLPYLDAITLESVRMFMGRGFSVPHRALKDTKLQGYSIPKDTMVVANTHAVFFNEDLFKNPNEFNPDRFIDENGQVFIPEYFLPFGYGHHRCLGEVLAKANVFLLTASLLQNFTFLPVPGEEFPTTECIDGVSPSPYPYSALVIRR